MPDTLKRIGYSAFEGCKDLTEIILPPNLSSIGSSAFRNCSNLKKISFNSELTSIDSKAFQNCTALEVVDLSNTKVSKLEAHSFSGCANLTSLILPDMLTYIPEFCFANCSKLKLISFGSELTTIGQRSFMSCESLERLDLSKTNVHNVFASSFAFCKNLSDISLPVSYPNINFPDFKSFLNLPIANVTVPNDHKFVKSIDGVIYNKELNGLMFFPPYLNKENYKIIDECTTICSDVLNNCEYLKRIDLNNCDNVQDRCLMECDALENVKISKKMGLIPLYFCFGCANLKSIYIPKNIQAICSYAFDSTGLEQIRIDGNPNIIDSCFTNISPKCTVKCIPGSKIEKMFREDPDISTTILPLSSDINNFLEDITDKKEQNTK